MLVLDVLLVLGFVGWLGVFFVGFFLSGEAKHSVYSPKLKMENFLSLEGEFAEGQVTWALGHQAKPGSSCSTALSGKWQ